MLPPAILTTKFGPSELRQIFPPQNEVKYKILIFISQLTYPVLQEYQLVVNIVSIMLVEISNLPKLFFY